MLDQINAALGLEGLPTSGKDLDKQLAESSGLREEALSRVRDWLDDLPAGSNLREQILDPAIELTRTIVELVIAVFFTFAIAAYWIFERDRTINGLLRFFRPESRQRAYNTWMLIDAKLGAFVRGQLILIVFVATVLSTLFRSIDLPYWLLIGLVAGLVEIIPIIGPNLAGLLAVGAGFTDSWQKGLLAGLIVFAVRMFQDYVVSPRVLGRAVGMSPLFVLLAVGVVGLLFGGFYVILALPLLAVLATVFDVIVLEKDPAKERVPKVIFPSKDVEGSTEGG
jgi:predicted PurR-regulated permease PerM